MIEYKEATTATSEDLFLLAVEAYGAWINTGKDFMNHANLFEAWDVAVGNYADSAMLRRNQAVSHIVQALGVLK